jgi:hypothetical protein
MVDFASLLEFSHTHCVTICAVLVPLNLLASLQTIILAGLSRPVSQIGRSAVIASLCALVMVLHVMTWFVIGVVMAPTYILLTLGSVCLSINLWAIGHPASLRGVLVWLGRQVRYSAALLAPFRILQSR